MASRLGHGNSGIDVCAQSFSGDVQVYMYAYHTPDDSVDYVCITARGHAHMDGYVELYNGPVAQLLEQSGRKTLVQELAKEFLIDEAA